MINTCNRRDSKYTLLLLYAALYTLLCSPLCCTGQSTLYAIRMRDPQAHLALLGRTPGNCSAEIDGAEATIFGPVLVSLGIL